MQGSRDVDENIYLSYLKRKGTPRTYCALVHLWKITGKYIELHPSIPVKEEQQECMNKLIMQFFRFIQLAIRQTTKMQECNSRQKERDAML